MWCSLEGMCASMHPCFVVCLHVPCPRKGLHASASSAGGGSKCAWGAARLFEPHCSVYYSLPVLCYAFACAHTLRGAQSFRDSMCTRAMHPVDCRQMCVVRMITCGTGSCNVVVSFAFVCVDCWCTCLVSLSRMRVFVSVSHV